MNLEVVKTDALRFEGGPADVNDYLLSPYVYADGRAIAVRAVPRRDDDPSLKISRVFRGRSTDRRSFILEDTPIVAPGEDVDRGGVEDPTVVADGGLLQLFYSGWDPLTERSTLLRAEGTRAGAFVKRGPVFRGKDAPQAKEATLLRRNGGWTMFFETEGEASLNASATAPDITGPWTLGASVVEPRRGYFDSANISPVAFVTAPSGARMLIYNGADADARWQVGWCMLDEACGRVLDRCDEPIIHAQRNAPEQRELSFGASVVERDGKLELYYSVGDTDPMCATLRWLA